MLLDDLFELNIPIYLPENALVTDLASFRYADGHEERYLTMLNTPNEDYVAHKINDGHEFAIGGEPAHILQSLNYELRSRLHQRWYAVVVPEDNLQLFGVPRRTYGMISGIDDYNSESADGGVGSQQSFNDGDSLMVGGPVQPPDHVYYTQGLNCQTDSGSNGLGQPEQIGGFDDLDFSNGGFISPSDHGHDNPGFTEQGQAQQNHDFSDILTNGGLVDFSDHVPDIKTHIASHITKSTKLRPHRSKPHLLCMTCRGRRAFQSTMNRSIWARKPWNKRVPAKTGHGETEEIRCCHRRGRHPVG